jgi:hypothetical protein
VRFTLGVLLGCCVAAFCATEASALAAGGGAWMSTHRRPAAHALLRAMTLGAKVNLVTGDTGRPEPNYGAAGVVFANPRLCIPALVLNDAASRLSPAATSSSSGTR